VVVGPWAAGEPATGDSGSCGGCAVAGCIGAEMAVARPRLRPS
jgi:hypothetical protein